jgi:phosphatidylinositol dimannoside acyltransferase
VRRLRTALIRALSAVAGALPEPPLVALAEAAGEIWYRVAPARAGRARRNLARVATALARDGRGSALARRAADDPDALERLVRRAFRHAARYYLEVARTPATTPADVRRRLDVETPEVVDQIVAGAYPVILVGAHFGAIELPIMYVADRVGYRMVAPMETVADPGLQAWIERSRTSAGIRAVPLEHARRELLAELRAGRSVGIVGDRDITGGGLRVPFFGAPAPLPIGAALLAVETGAPLVVGGARRTAGGRYAGWLARIDVPESGSRRERVAALVAATAACFEELIGQAPEQWWAAFQPIWPDLEGADDARARKRTRTASPAASPDPAPTDRASAVEVPA